MAPDSNLNLRRSFKQAAVKITSNEGEATLRRKESSRGGPRVTRNITEAEVMDQIHEICTNGHPYDKYTRDIELGNEPLTSGLNLHRLVHRVRPKESD